MDKKKKKIGNSQNPAIFIENQKESLKVGECLLTKLGNTKITDKPIISLIFNQETGELRIFKDPFSKENYLNSLDKQNLNNITENYENIPLLHSDNCSSFKLYQMTQSQDSNFTFQQSENPIRLATCAVLVDNQNKVLLTKRANSLRTFPNCWVVPGGRVDPKESIIYAMKRELLEEVGVNMINRNRKKQVFIEEQDAQINPLCAYMSISPQKIEQGFPQYQNLVIFYTVKLLKFNNSQLNLSLQQSEVDLASWVNLSEMKNFYVNNSQEPENNIMVKVIQSSNQKKEISIPLQMMYGRYPNKFGEGVGEAHEKAFQCLFNDKYNQGFFHYQDSNSNAQRYSEVQQNQGMEIEKELNMEQKIEEN